jgi:hypothetical protein
VIINKESFLERKKKKGEERGKKGGEGGRNGGFPLSSALQYELREADAGYLAEI